MTESNQPLKQELESTFRDIVVTDDGDGRLTIVASPAQVITVLALLRDRGFDHLALVSAVDRIENQAFEVVYILTSYAENTGARPRLDGKLLIVKTVISRADPRLKSAIGVFANAEPYEREIHELFGIHFEGHPRLIPLFLERQYSTPPFRKDFDTRKYVEDVFDTIPFVGEEDQ
jgi:NADH-quinone oxidoreductase subunit C